VYKRQVPDTRGRLRVTIDSGTPAQETPGATSSGPQEPTPEPARSK
jgi:hypothetical protein